MKKIECGTREFYDTLVTLSNSDTSRWEESVYYELTQNQIKKLKKATSESMDLVNHTIDQILKHNQLSTFNIREDLHKRIDDSFNCYLVGDYTREFNTAIRLDFKWNGINKPSLINIEAGNADNLTEAAVTQKDWATYHEHQQFNNIDHDLAQCFGILSKEIPLCFPRNNNPLFKTLSMIASMASLDTKWLDVSTIEYNPLTNYFIDNNGDIIDYWFKHGNWDQFIADNGSDLVKSTNTIIVEPIFTMLTDHDEFIQHMLTFVPSFQYINHKYDNEEVFHMWYVDGKVSGLSVSVNGKTIPHVLV